MTEIMEAPPIPGSLVLDYAPHESFAQDVAIGEPYSVAYRRHILKGDSADETVWSSATKLAADPRVVTRVRFLKTEISTAVNGAMGITGEFLAREHLAILKTPVGEIDEHHYLAQKVKKRRMVTGSGEDAEVWEVMEVEMPGKSRALDALAELGGHNAPSKSETTIRVGPVSNSLADILSTPAAIAHTVQVLAGTEEGIRAMEEAVKNARAIEIG